MFWRNYWWVLFALLLLLPLGASAIFAWWIRRKGMDVNESSKCWDVFLKFLSTITAIFVGAFVFAKYVDQKNEADAKARLIQEVEYLKGQVNGEDEKQKMRTKLFGDAKSVVAQLAAATDAKAVSLATPVRQRFEELYSGSLIGVEKRHGEVERAMVNFRTALNQWEETPAARPDLHQLSVKLSQACVQELKEGEDTIQGLRKQIKDLYARGRE
jgi:hypothetical protein